jgi:hypothetical protein
MKDVKTIFDHMFRGNKQIMVNIGKRIVTIEIIIRVNKEGLKLKLCISQNHENYFITLWLMQCFSNLSNIIYVPDPYEQY